MKPTAVGQLACQLNTYLRSLKATVVSCTAGQPARAAGDLSKASSEAPSAVFDIVVSDSVLFPEGGGQPWDLGTINEHPVTAVVRRGDACVLQSPQEFAVGTEVEMVVDWPRRVDHFQHHTAQHLLTAVVERELGLPTVSWSLSQPFCCIQLNTAKVDEADVRRIEDLCAAEIAKATPVECTTYASREALPEARTRSIPADVTGPLRLIEIPEIDACTCCGTHASTLAEISPVLLLHQEAKGSTCRLFFVAGDRARAHVASMYGRERALTKELGTAPADFVTAVSRRAKVAADVAKAQKRVLKELAALTAPKVVEAAAAKASDDAAKPFFFQHDDADGDFLSTIGAALSADARTKDLLCVLGAGGLKDQTPGAGQLVVVCSDSERIKAFAADFLPKVEGKGGLSKQGYRGKCTMGKWGKAVKEFAK